MKPVQSVHLFLFLHLLCPLKSRAAEILYEEGRTRVVTGDWAARVTRGIPGAPRSATISLSALQEAMGLSEEIAGALADGLKRYGWAQLEHELDGVDPSDHVRAYVPEATSEAVVLEELSATGQVRGRISIADEIRREKYDYVPISDRSVYLSLQSVDLFVTNQEHFVKQFFEEMLDLEYQGLEKVREAYDSGKPILAIEELSEYFRHKAEPASLIRKPAGKPTAATVEAAELLARNVFPGWGTTVDFGERIEWSRQREGVVEEWLWGLNAHYHFRTLLEAYLQTGNEKYARTFTHHITDWIVQNPAPPYTLTRVATWRNLEAGTRGAVTWPAAFYGFLCSPSFTPQTILLVLGSLWSHGDYLYEHPAGLRRPSNWSVIDQTGLAGISLYFPEFRDSAKWRDEAYSRLACQLSLQVYPDGAQWELAPGYHLFCLNRFDLAYRLAAENGYSLPRDFSTRLESMYDYVMWLAQPDGTLPAFSDTHPGVGATAVLKEGVERFGRQDMLYVATNGEEGVPPKETSHHLPWAGWTAMRSGWDRNALHLCFDGGPVGTGHQHEDMLSFVLTAYGKSFIIDPGPYVYTNDKWRNYAISTFAHSTVLADGLCQTRTITRKEFEAPEQPESVWESNDRFDYTSATYKAGYRLQEPDVVHRRHVVFIKPEYWVIADEILGEGTHEWEALFHLAPNLEVGLDRSLVASTQEATGANLVIAPSPMRGLQGRIIKGQEEPFVQGWYVPGPDTRVPAPVVSYRARVELPFRQVYVLWPVQEGVPTPPHVSLESAPDQLRIEVTRPDLEQVDVIRILPMENRAELERRQGM